MTSRVFFGQTVLEAGQSPSQAGLPFFYVATENLSSTSWNIHPQAAASGDGYDLLSFISLAPVLVAFLVLLLRAFLAIPYRPRWLQRFANEQVDDPKTLTDGEVTKARPNLPNALLALAVFGSITQIIAIVLGAQDLTPVSRVVAWVRTISETVYLHC